MARTGPGLIPFSQGELVFGRIGNSISGAQLFKDAFTGNTLNETESKATTPGPLYVNPGGKPGLCMNRWRFWLSRLGELGDTGVDQKVGLEAIQAAHRMEEIIKQDGRAEARRLGIAEEDLQSK